MHTSTYVHAHARAHVHARAHTRTHRQHPDQDRDCFRPALSHDSPLLSLSPHSSGAALNLGGGPGYNVVGGRGRRREHPCTHLSASTALLPGYAVRVQLLARSVDLWLLLVDPVKHFPKFLHQRALLPATWESFRHSTDAPHGHPWCFRHSGAFP